MIYVNVSFKCVQKYYNIFKKQKEMKNIFNIIL